MSGFFTWCWQGFASCCLIGVAGTALLSTAAEATTGDGAAFAQTAVVTHWSLPPPERAVGVLLEQEFARSLERPHTTLARPAAATDASTTMTPATTHVAQLVGPTLADGDLEARGTVQLEGKQPDRTPRDIKRLQIAFQVLNAADAVTTVVCLKRDDCQENNPLYGKHPKPIVVIGAKTLVGAIHYFAMRSLATDYPDLARALGWVTVSIQGGVVGMNLSQLL